MYMRGRRYDPELGRFIQEDPIHSGVNDYVFAGNDPVNGSDPSGMDEQISCTEWDLVTYVDGVEISEDYITTTCSNGDGSSGGGGGGSSTAPQQPKPTQPKPKPTPTPKPKNVPACFDNNKFSSLFAGTPLHGTAEFLEVGSEVSFAGDLFAYRKKLGGMGLGGFGKDYASGMNRLFRYVARGVGSPVLQRGLVAVGDRITVPTAVIGAFSAGYNVSTLAQCALGVLQ